MKSSFISSLLRLVRKTTLVGCCTGLIAFLAVWVFLAFPEKTKRLFDNDRISVVQRMGSGTRIYFSLGTKHPMPYKGTTFPLYQHKAVLAITKTSAGVSWNSTYDAPQTIAENGIRFAGFKAVHRVQHAEGHPPYLLWYISRTVAPQEERSLLALWLRSYGQCVRIVFRMWHGDSTHGHVRRPNDARGLTRGTGGSPTSVGASGSSSGTVFSAARRTEVMARMTWSASNQRQRR